MRVDLYTDAGVTTSRSAGVAGLGTWALVAIVPGASAPLFEASGVLRDKVLTSTVAELRAIANGLHKLHRLGYVERGSEVHIYTDSLTAAERINGGPNRKPLSPITQTTLAILKFGEIHGLTLAATWIRAHRPDSADEHAKWNNRCDALCRLARSPKVDDRPTPPADAQPVAKVKTKARTALDTARRLEGRA